MFPDRPEAAGETVPAEHGRGRAEVEVAERGRERRAVADQLLAVRDGGRRLRRQHRIRTRPHRLGTGGRQHNHSFSVSPFAVIFRIEFSMI